MAWTIGDVRVSLAHEECRLLTQTTERHRFIADVSGGMNMTRELGNCSFRRAFLGAFAAMLFAGILVTASAQTAQTGGIVMSDAAANRALSKGEVSMDAATRIVKACEQFATQHNVLAVAYVLDPFGSIVYAHRMDGIRPMESEAALARAKAALFNRGPSGGGGGGNAPNPNASVVGQVRAQMRGQQELRGDCRSLLQIRWWARWAWPAPIPWMKIAHGPA